MKLSEDDVIGLDDPDLQPLLSCSRLVWIRSQPRRLRRIVWQGTSFAFTYIWYQISNGR